MRRRSGSVGLVWQLAAAILGFAAGSPALAGGILPFAALVRPLTEFTWPLTERFLRLAVLV